MLAAIHIYPFLYRCVLSKTLKVFILLVDLTDCGKEFHRVGAATTNAQSPIRDFLHRVYDKRQANGKPEEVT